MSKGKTDKKSFMAGVAVRYGQQLRRFLASRLRHGRDAPDLAQEVYLRLLRVEGYELIRNPEAYLITIANNLLHEHALRESSAPRAVDIDAVVDELRAPEQDNPIERADTEGRVEALWRALEKLSPKAQATLVLHRRDGYSLEEIGTQLGISRAMAKKYLAKALLHCRASPRRERS